MEKTPTPIKNDQPTSSVIVQNSTQPTGVSSKTVKKSPKNISIHWLWLVIVLTAGLIVAVWYAATMRVNNQSLIKNNQSSNQQDKNSYRFNDENLTISQLAEKVSPSVVSITTTVNVDGFWGSTTSQSAGTGVVLSKDGYILTNKHVVGDTKKIAVVTSDGKIYEDVKRIFVDPLNDLAFLKINNVDNLQPIEIGDSKTIKVGQPVLAIGNALGEYRNTVTNGIISGMGRNIVAQDLTGRAENLSDLIQTNAAINSGNSGGPLVNAGGQLIGINTAIAQNANGIGFAIPIAAAKGIIKQLGKVPDDGIKRGFIGISYLDITPTSQKKYNLENVSRGALIGNGGIRKNSPAEKAGLKEGDIIVKLNGYEIGVVGGLSTLGAEYQPGEEVLITVLRNGDMRDIKLTIGSY